MIENYIEKYENINPVYLIDFSISEQHVLNELKKRKKEELEVFAPVLLKNAIYFGYKKVYTEVMKLFKNLKNEKRKSRIEKLAGYAFGENKNK